MKSIIIMKQFCTQVIFMSTGYFPFELILNIFAASCTGKIATVKYLLNFTKIDKNAINKQNETAEAKLKRLIGIIVTIEVSSKAVEIYFQQCVFCEILSIFIKEPTVSS